MKITVSGNIRYYQDYELEEDVVIKSYILEGSQNTFSSPLNFSGGNILLKSFTSKVDLYNFCTRIQGKSLESLKYEFYDNNNQNYFHRIEYLKNASLQELGLIKSLFTIYPWVEFELENHTEFKIKKYIYDEFTLDYSSKVGPQKDIYFIKNKYTNERYENDLEFLIRVNLLCKLKIQLEENSWTSYFIPLIKPGVKKEIFTKSNKLRAYQIWKEIINERNVRIHQFIKRN